MATLTGLELLAVAAVDWGKREEIEAGWRSLPGGRDAWRVVDAHLDEAGDLVVEFSEIVWDMYGGQND